MTFSLEGDSLYYDFGSKEWDYAYILEKLLNIAHLKEGDKEKIKKIRKAALERDRSFKFGRADEKKAKSTSLGHVRIVGVQDLYDSRTVLNPLYGSEMAEYVTTSLYIPPSNEKAKRNKFIYEFAPGYDISLFTTDLNKEN